MSKTAALITGASSGLGREYALQLARRGRRKLIITARRKERLESVRNEIAAAAPSPDAAAEVEVLVCDLRSRADRQELIAHIDAGADRLDLLVNNAGFGSLGPFTESDPAWEQDMIEVDCIAPVHLCRHFAPRMQAGGGGAIINVCSTAAFQAMPYMATYGAAKAFLLSFSLALDAELASGAGHDGRQPGSPVRVLAHCPGPTATEFHLVVGLNDKMDFLPSASAEQVVREAIAAVEHGRAPIWINGFFNRMLAHSNRVLPRALAARMVERILRRTAHSAGS